MKYLLMIVLLCVVSQTRADVRGFFSGNQLLERCEPGLRENKTTEDLFNVYECLGYIKGIFDVHGNLIDFGVMKPVWCMPKGVSLDQLLRIVTKYLQEHYESLHTCAGTHVINAFVEAFPCR